MDTRFWHEPRIADVTSGIRTGTVLWSFLGLPISDRRCRVYPDKYVKTNSPRESLEDKAP